MDQETRPDPQYILISICYRPTVMTGGWGKKSTFYKVNLYLCLFKEGLVFIITRIWYFAAVYEL